MPWAVILYSFILFANIKSKDACGVRAIHPCPEETRLFAHYTGKDNDGKRVAVFVEDDPRSGHAFFHAGLFETTCELHAFARLFSSNTHACRERR